MATNDYAFERARVALFDPQYMNRQTTLGALQTMGFASVEPIGRFEDLMSYMAHKDFDILIAEMQGVGPKLAEYTHALRHRRIGQNPFAIVLMTTWSLTQDAVRLAINSGADDLLARPFTIAQLRQRLVASHTSRKPFVVTCDYVGPSRRKARRPEDEVGQITVPNTFGAKVSPTAGEVTRDDIEAAWQQVLYWKAFRFAERMAALAKSLDPLHLAPEGTIGSLKLVEGIARLAADLKLSIERFEEGEFETIRAYCEVMEKLASRDASSLEQRTETVKLVREIADHILARVNDIRPAPAVGRRMDTVVIA